MAAFDLVQQAETEVSQLLDLSFHHNEMDWLEIRRKMCACILENASSIKDWIVYQQLAAECRKNGLSPVCDAYEAGLPYEEVMTVYLRSIYHTIILSVIEREPVLNGFTGTAFNEQIAQFKRMDQEFMELTKEEMYCRLTHQLPTSSDSVTISKELNILRRAISSNGRGISVRTLFEQIPHVLPRLCPCMLMSPISAAQYLQPDNDLFDVVVFDEASQLPTCKAVGVLARGKNAVIVGDPNQMPPTSFFAGNTVDEDNLDIEDLDSILDDCLALGMPQSHLHWHYRSRHESLIAFSNQEFYENAMFTFPSVNDREKRVRLEKVDGFFDRGKGRVNEGEAQAIVHEIKQRYLDPQSAGQSIGVVTFNISQQTLIEDLLLEEYQKDPEFDKWANIGEETLFVKNLENVQGDERDVILFSIAFGPDAEGKLSMNFGPLNKDGGWKRLNVAVSRARSEMVVFTTMTADMIDLKRTKSKGVEALKDFLEFAEKGRLQGECTEYRVQKDQGILESICRELSKHGYRYQEAVGHSKFRVDIAVVNPYNEEEYLLGIMLDGESYRQSSNAKDREVAQMNVLSGLGWKLHRIWTMDWWDNRDREISKLMEILDNSKAAAFGRYQKEQPVTDGIEDSLKDKELPDREQEETKNVSVNMVAETDMDTKTAASPENREDPVNHQITVSHIAEYPMMKTPIPEESEFASAALPDVRAMEPGAQPEPIIPEYRLEEYLYADVTVMEMSTSAYVKQENMARICEKMQEILNKEAPISYERLIKKTLRSFNIVRSSTQTLDATDKALKKILSRRNKQSGLIFYWRKDQDPDMYRVYRVDANTDDRRSVDEICQQELKNAVCVTLAAKGPLDKDSLIKETIRTMGYMRSRSALIEAVERGLRYGKKTGEIGQNAAKQFVLTDRE